MTYRIEYMTMSGGMIVEYIDDTRLHSLLDAEKNGLIKIQNHVRF